MSLKYLLKVPPVIHYVPAVLKNLMGKTNPDIIKKTITQKYP
jgi:hypothetical protein